MVFEFVLDSHFDSLRPAGNASPFKDREASPEEIRLWYRVQELERILDSRCTVYIRELLTNFPKQARIVALHPVDIEKIEQQAPHRILVLSDAHYLRQGICGEVPYLVCGRKFTMRIKADRAVKPGTARIVEYQSENPWFPQNCEGCGNLHQEGPCPSKSPA